MRLALLAAAAMAAVGLATGSSAASVLPCTGSMLSGTFSVIPGSAGAGNIVYALKLRNRSTTTCFVSGLAGLRLLGKTGRALPTRVEPAFRPGLTAVRVVLRPGARAKATARFSPDVPGPNKPTTGRQCEPTAYRVRVTPPPGGGTLIAPVSPPTPVCSHGYMSLSALSPG
ncbi:MAG TPA: DUF4232 domain-containing protein [Gaiellaceae bacterium]